MKNELVMLSDEESNRILDPIRRSLALQAMYQYRLRHLTRCGHMSIAVYAEETGFRQRVIGMDGGRVTHWCERGWERTQDNQPIWDVVLQSWAFGADPHYFGTEASE